METRVDYLVRTSAAVEPKERKCNHCFAVYGTEIREGSMILIGTVPMEYFGGECGNCGRKLSWSSVDRLMDRITKSAKARAR